MDKYTGLQIDDNLIFSFSEQERREYDLQIEVLQRQLTGAFDELNNYTCHSLPHIIEVQQQVAMLFNEMRDWLIDKIGFLPDELSDARKLLLLAAKYHDIGMSGTLSLRELLRNVDRQHDLCLIRTQDARQKWIQLIREMRDLAEQSDKELMHWNKLGYLCNQRYNRILSYGTELVDANRVLAEYHEDIKNAIRRHHAENSARWIVSHRKDLVERYGAKVNWDKVALLTAMHGGSLRECIDSKNNIRSIEEYCNALAESIGMENPHLTHDSESKKLKALASILRLGDQRRSGSNLLTMSKECIMIEEMPSRRLEVFYIQNGVKKQPDASLSRQIILSEKLNEFGSVNMEKQAGTWSMTHELTFFKTDKLESQALLLFKRLPYYIEELEKSLLIGDICHLLIVHLKPEKDVPINEAPMDIDPHAVIGEKHRSIGSEDKIETYNDTEIGKLLPLERDVFLRILPTRRT